MKKIIATLSAIALAFCCIAAEAKGKSKSPKTSKPHAVKAVKSK